MIKAWASQCVNASIFTKECNTDWIVFVQVFWIRSRYNDIFPFVGKRINNMQTHTGERNNSVFIGLLQLKHTLVLYGIIAFVNMELQKMFAVIAIEAP